MLFHLYYLASLASVSFPCISSVWFGGTAHLHISPSGHCLSIEICFLNIVQCRTNLSPLQCAHTVFTVDGPLPHSVDVSLGLCFNSGSAPFQFNGSLPVLCKKQGLNHSHPNFTAMLPIHHCPLYPLLPGSFP